MENLEALYRRTIGLTDERKPAFSDLNTILERTARTMPFENLCIIENRVQPLTAQNLIDKLLVRREGGLCYELNTMLFLYLKAGGFDVELVRAIVYNPDTASYSAAGRTHVAILLHHEGLTYVVDTGFGGNLPLRPVPISGEVIASATGEFRIRPAEGDHAEHGDYSFEMRIRHRDDDWKLGYTFDSRRSIGLEECADIQRIITEHPASGFNKRPLVTRLTARGGVTLTDTSLTITEDGVVTKETFDPPLPPQRFDELIERHFGRS